MTGQSPAFRFRHPTGPLVVSYPGLPPAPPSEGDCTPRPVRRVTRRMLAPSLGVPCICGRCVPGATGKAGRPSDYCKTNLTDSGKNACREVLAAFNILEKWLGTVATNATPDGWLSIRSRLFMLANQRTWNKGLRLPRVAS